MLELHLDQEADLLLAHFAAQQGMSKSEVACRAVLQFLEDREDYEAGVAALKESESQPSYSIEEVVKSLGLETEFLPQIAQATGKPGQNSANSKA